MSSTERDARTQPFSRKPRPVEADQIRSCSLLFVCLILPTLFLNSLELLGDILREKPQEADGIDSMVVVDNVPQVGPERLEKLKNVIHKIFSKFGKITTEFYPDADGMTKGYDPVVSDVFFCCFLSAYWIQDFFCTCSYIFLEYAAPTQALEAVKNADGYKLDKQHTFRVNLFTDFDKYVCTISQYVR